MNNATDEESLRKIVLENSAIDIITDAGYNMPLACITLAKRDSLVKCIRQWSSVLSVKAQLDQIRCGLQSLGVLQYMETYPELFKWFFCAQEKDNITAGLLPYVH